MWSSSALSHPRRRVPNWVPAFAGTTSALAAMAILLAACGFQLRGETTTGLKTIHVPGSGVALEIRRTLAGSPTRVLPTAEGAEAVLQIISENRDKHVNTITGAGRVYEYQ